MNPTNPNGQFDLTDLPSGMSLDDLFLDEPTSATSQSLGTPEVPAAQPQAAPAPVQPFWEPLKTATGSVYNTREDAIRGVEEKDTLLAQLRQQLAASTGVDPLRKSHQSAQPEAPQGYLQDPERYMRDLVNGAENSPKDYINSQLQLFNEYLAPLGPAIQEIVKSRAEKQIATTAPDFEAVRNSPHYKAVLEELPDLRDAIYGAEMNFQASDKLPGLYKIAYLAARGRQLPELLNAQQVSQPAPVPSAAPTQARPSLNSSQPMPPVTQGAVQPSVLTPEGRKAIFEQMESRGILDRKF
jgi:hypothetical protein